MRYVFGGKLGIFLQRRRGVAGANDNVAWDRHLPQPGLVHAESLDVSGSHRKCRLHPIIAQVTGGRRVNLHLLAQILRHHLIVFPYPLECQKQVGINLGSADPEGGKSPLRMARNANLIGVYVWPPSLVLEEMRDLETEIPRSLPQPVLRT